MKIETILADKTIKPKEKTEALSLLLLEKKLSVSELIDFANHAKDSAKATSIEALEFATKTNPKLATKECLQFVSSALTDKAPRIKWESAKVIGNIAPLFADQLDIAIAHLLTNTEHSGTVVRWSAAFALGEILKTGHPKTRPLLSTIEAICQREEKKSIKKIYLSALKKIKT